MSADTFEDLYKSSHFKTASSFLLGEGGGGVR